MKRDTTVEDHEIRSLEEFDKRYLPKTHSRRLLHEDSSRSDAGTGLVPEVFQLVREEFKRNTKS